MGSEVGGNKALFTVHQKKKKKKKKKKKRPANQTEPDNVTPLGSLVASTLSSDFAYDPVGRCLST